MTAMSTAKEFWNAMARSVPVQCATIARWSQILESYTDIDKARDAVVDDLKKHGVDTDVTSFKAAYADTIQNAIGFWEGHYLLRGDNGGLFSLTMSEDLLQLTSIEKNAVLLNVVSGFTLATQVLNYDDAAIGLKLELALTDTSGDTKPEDLFDHNDRIFQIVKGGSITFKGTPATTVALSGKQGVFTVKGLESSICGDPVSVWQGSYNCQYADDGSAFSTIAVGAGADSAAQISMGGRLIAKSILRNNCIGFSPAAAESVCARLICDPGGARVMEGIAQSSDGTLRPFRGVADTPYVDAARRRMSIGPVGVPMPPATVCDVANDQTIELGDPSTYVQPSLTALPVTYEDGSAGTIQIEAVRPKDAYSVPPGRMIVYHKPDANTGRTAESDATLAVGWLVGTPVKLLTMVQPDYYQLRLTLGGWHNFDNAGVAISLIEDDEVSPGFLSLRTPDVIGCPSGAIGTCSSVPNFKFATAVLSVTQPVRLDGSLKYRFELAGKGSSPDNCSGSRDGFLQVKLRFLTATGTEKLPPQSKTLPMLLDVELPVDVTPQFKVTGPEIWPLVGQGRKFEMKVQATGGVAPYAVTPFGALNPFGITCVEDKSPAPGVSQWSITGVVPVNIGAGYYSYGLCFQSDPKHTVSAGFVPLQVGVLNMGPPWALLDYATPPVRRAFLNTLYGQLFGSWAFYQWHGYLADYGPLSFWDIPSSRRAAARLAIVFMQPIVAELGQAYEEFIVSWYTFIENYGHVGGIVDLIMSNLDSWKPFITYWRSQADDAWAKFTDPKNDLLTRTMAYAAWFLIDEILYILFVERMATHEEIEIYLAARNNSLPTQ